MLKTISPEEKLLVISESSNKNRNQKETVAMIESRFEGVLKFNSVNETSKLFILLKRLALEVALATSPSFQSYRNEKPLTN